MGNTTEAVTVTLRSEECSLAEATTELSAISPIECLMWTIGVLAKDAQWNDQERRSIGQLAAKYRIADSLSRQWITEALAGELDRPKSSDPAITTGWLNRMVGAVVADGRLDNSDRELLAQLGGSLKMSDYDLDLVMRKSTFR